MDTLLGYTIAAISVGVMVTLTARRRFLKEDEQEYGLVFGVIFGLGWPVLVPFTAFAGLIWVIARSIEKKLLGRLVE